MRTLPGLRQAVVFVLVFVLAFCLASVVSAQQPQVAPSAQQAPSADAPPASDNQYLIGPGDSLQVFVWRNQDLSVTVPVRPDGRISTPLVENMVAVGKTPSQLARDIEGVLAEYIRSPKVNIIVTAPVGALGQVKVIGEVTKPQAIPFHEGMTVLDAVLQAGGLSQYASGNRAKIVRNEAGKTQTIRVKIDNLVNKGDVSQNFRLRPGDVLVVPQSLF